MAKKSRTPPPKKAAAPPNTSVRAPAEKRGGDKNESASVNAVDFPIIERIKGLDDLAREINALAKGGRKASLDNALAVGAAFQHAELKGYVTWGQHKTFCETRLSYSPVQVRVFRGLLADRAKIEPSVAWYEKNKESLTFPLRKGSGIDFHVQVLRAFTMYNKALEGSKKDPPLDPQDALEVVSIKMSPKAGGRGNTTTTTKERETILGLLVAQSFKDRSLVKHWKTPLELSDWLMTVHPLVRDALLDEANASSQQFSRTPFARIPYPDRMSKLWGWKEGMKPDAGEDENFNDDDDDDDDDETVVSVSTRLTDTPDFPFDVEHLHFADDTRMDLKKAWDFLSRHHHLTAKQIATWAGMQKTAKTLRAKVHPDTGGDADEAQKVGGALDVLVANHPKKPLEKPSTDEQSGDQPSA